MSKYTDFRDKNLNKPVEVVDPTNYAQCFDLVVAWADTLGIPRVFNFLYAYEIYSKFGPTQAQHFDRIFNGPTDVPKEGDILVWSYYYNYTAGHTAICNNADINRVKAFSQNDPTGARSILRDYNYSNMLGWLRPKNYNTAPVPMTDAQIVKAHKDIVNTNISDTEYRTKSRGILKV